MNTVSEKPWHKQFWPWFLIVLPSVVIIACLFTVYLAVKNPLSMVKKDYYQEGLTINKNKTELKRAEALGLQAHILLQHNNTIHVDLRSARAINPPHFLELNFNHPVDDAKDVALVLILETEQGNVSSYVIDKINREQWRLLVDEKHWYVQLQSSSAGKMDWMLQGETDHAAVSELILDPSGG